MGGGGFRDDIALRHAQHFKSHHEFFYARGAQEWWVKMRMKMPFRVPIAIRRRLMKAH